MVHQGYTNDQGVYTSTTRITHRPRVQPRYSESIIIRKRLSERSDPFPTTSYPIRLVFLFLFLFSSYPLRFYVCEICSDLCYSCCVIHFGCITKTITNRTMCMRENKHGLSIIGHLVRSGVFHPCMIYRKNQLRRKFGKWGVDAFFVS